MQYRILQKIQKKRFCNSALRLADNDLVRIQQCFDKGLHEGVVAAYENLREVNGQIDRESLTLVLHGFARSAVSLDPSSLMQHAAASGVDLDQSLFADIFTVCVLKDDHQGVQYVLDAWSKSFSAADFPWNNILNILIKTYGMQHHIVQNSIMKLASNIVAPGELFKSFHNYSSQESIQQLIREMEKSISLGYTKVAFSKFSQLEGALKRANSNFGSVSETPEWVTMLISLDLNHSPLQDLPSRLTSLQIEIPNRKLNTVINRAFQSGKSGLPITKRSIEYYDAFNCTPDAKVWNRLIGQMIMAPPKEVSKHPGLLYDFMQKRQNEQALSMYYKRLIKSMLSLNSTDDKTVIYNRCLPMFCLFSKEQINKFSGGEQRTLSLQSLRGVMMLKPKRETFMIVTSAPEDSGLRTGDHVISINGEPIRASEQRKFLHSKMANALETGELTIEVESNDVQRILSSAPIHSPAVFDFCKQFELVISAKDFGNFLRQAQKEHNLEALVATMKYGVQRQLHQRLPEHLWHPILDSLLLSHRLDLPFSLEKLNLHHCRRNQLASIMSRNRSAEVDPNDLEEHVRPFLSLVSSYIHSKQNASTSWEPEIPRATRTNPERLRRQKLFPSQVFENMMLFLCVSNDPQHVQILLESMSDAGIAPSPRMRDMISTHISEKERERLLQLYFQNASDSEESIYHSWIRRKHIGEALFWAKRGASEEDRLLCLLAIGKELQGVKINELRHEIHLTRNSQSDEIEELTVPFNVWSENRDAFLVPLAAVDIECDVRISEGEQGYKIRGVPSEREKATSIIRSHFEQHNYITPLARGLGFVGKMRNEKEFGGLLVGGIQGKDEAHLWGNPFVRHQKAKLLETIVQEHKELSVFEGSRSYFERLEDIPVAEMEAHSKSKFVFPLSHQDRIYVLGTPQARRRAFDMLLALNPPLGEEQVSYQSRPTSQLFKAVQENDLSILDVQWLANRMTSEEGQAIANLVNDLINSSPELVKSIPRSIFTNSSLPIVLQRELLCTLLEILVSKHAFDESISLASDFVDLLKARELQKFLKQLFLTFGKANHTRADPMQTVQMIQKFMAQITPRFGSEELIQPSSLCEFIYDSHMQKHPRLCRTGLEFATKYCRKKFPAEVYQWVASAQIGCSNEINVFLHSDLAQGTDEDLSSSFLKVCRKVDPITLAHFLQDFVTQIPLDRLALGLAKAGNVPCIEMILLKLEWIYRIDLIKNLDQVALELMKLTQDNPNARIQPINHCIERIIHFMVASIPENELKQDIFIEAMQHFSTTRDNERLTSIAKLILERRHHFRELADAINAFPQLKYN